MENPKPKGEPKREPPKFEAFAKTFLEISETRNKPSSIEAKESILRVHLTPCWRCGTPVAAAAPASAGYLSRRNRLGRCGQRWADVTDHAWGIRQSRRRVRRGRQTGSFPFLRSSSNIRCHQPMIENPDGKVGLPSAMVFHDRATILVDGPSRKHRVTGIRSRRLRRREINGLLRFSPASMALAMRALHSTIQSRALGRGHHAF